MITSEVQRLWWRLSWPEMAGNSDGRRVRTKPPEAIRVGFETLEATKKYIKNFYRLRPSG
jgi:hypothetical protein